MPASEPQHQLPMLLLLLLHFLAFRSCMATISVVQVTMSSNSTMTVMVMHDEPSNTGNLTVRLWKSDVARPANETTIRNEIFGLPAVGATVELTLNNVAVDEDGLCGCYFLCASATVGEASETLQRYQYKCIARHKNCTEDVDLQWLVTQSDDNKPTLSAQPGGKIMASGFTMSIANKGETAMARRSALNSPEVQVYLVYITSYMDSTEMNMPAFNLTANETNVMDAVERDRTHYLPFLDMWKEKWVRLKGLELLLTMTDGSGKALSKDEEISVDVMKLSAPESFAGGSALLVFVIDPFSKTNDANRENNILFAWINLTRGRSGKQCEVVPDAAVAGREALVQMNDMWGPSTHRFTVRPGTVEFSVVNEQTMKEKEEFAMASERAVRLAKLNLCPSAPEDTATNDSLLVKAREATRNITHQLSMLQPALSDVHNRVVALVRLVHNLTDQAARIHGPVRWLLTRLVTRLINHPMHPCLNNDYYDQGGYDVHGMDVDIDGSYGIVFPDSFHYTVDPGLMSEDEGDAFPTENEHSTKDPYNWTNIFRHHSENQYNDFSHESPPIYPVPSYNSYRPERSFPILRIVEKIRMNLPVKNIEELRILPQAMLEDLKEVIKLLRNDSMLFSNLLAYNGVQEALFEFWQNTMADVLSGETVALEDAIDRLINVLNTIALSPDFPFSAYYNETLEDTLNLATEYLTVIKNNSAMVTQVLEMITSVLAAPEKLCCLTKQPERAPNQEMVCLTAAQEDVRLIMKHSNGASEEYFRNVFNDAMRMRISQAEPTYWNIKDGKVYTIERCPLSGTFMWDQVAICSCSRDHGGYNDQEGERNHRGNGRGRGRDDVYGTVGTNEETDTPDFEFYEFHHEYRKDKEEPENRERFVSPLRHDNRSPRTIPHSTKSKNDYETLKPEALMSKLSFTASIKNVTVTTREESLVVSGRLQVAGWTRQRGEWIKMNGSVCSDGVWGDSEAKVACRMIFGDKAKGASSHIISNTGEQVPRPLLTQVSCQGTEDSLKACQHLWGRNACDGKELAGLRCVVPLT